MSFANSRIWSMPRSLLTRETRRRSFLAGRTLEQFEERVLLASLLGTAQTFAILGASTVTNTGATTIVGNVGLSPGSSITGFPPGVVTGGAIHINDAVANQAHADLATAYNDLAAMSSVPANNLSGQDLGGLTLLPGVYHFNTSAQLTGTLTLDAQGDPNATFVIQVGTTLTTATGAAVNIIDGGRSDNVYFQVGSSATIGTGTAFQGNIVADTSVTLVSGATLQSGRALALNGAVTLDTIIASSPQPSLALSKSADVPIISTGDTAAYSITLTNNGQGAANSVVITDPLPTGVNWVTTTPGVIISNGTLTDTIGNFDAGASVVIHVSGTTSTATPVTLANTATATAGNNLPASLSATATITVNKPNLAIIKTADLTAISTGDVAAYTITVSNSGAGNATGVDVTDSLPAGVAWTTTTPGASIVAGVLTDLVGNLASGASVVIHVSGTTTTATPVTLTNTATTTAGNNLPASLSATATITVLAPDLLVSEFADASPLFAGQVAGFQFRVSNIGQGTAVGLNISDLLPAGVNWSIVSGPGVINGLSLTAPSITSLAPGASFSIQVVGSSRTAGLLINVVTAFSSNESTSVYANNTALAGILVQPVSSPVTVANVVRRGVHLFPTVYVVSYNGAVDPTQAANLAHYQLVRENSQGRIISGSIPLLSATYNQASDTVTISPETRQNVHYFYRFLISGMTDTAGQPIIGSNGLAGSRSITHLSLKSYLKSVAVSTNRASLTSAATNSSAVHSSAVNASTPDMSVKVQIRKSVVRLRHNG